MEYENQLKIIITPEELEKIKSGKTYKLTIPGYDVTLMVFSESEFQRLVDEKVNKDN